AEQGGGGCAAQPAIRDLRAWPASLPGWPQANPAKVVGSWAQSLTRLPTESNAHPRIPMPRVCRKSSSCGPVVGHSGWQKGDAEAASHSVATTGKRLASSPNAELHVDGPRRAAMR